VISLVATFEDAVFILVPKPGGLLKLYLFCPRLTRIYHLPHIPSETPTEINSLVPADCDWLGGELKLDCQVVDNLLAIPKEYQKCPDKRKGWYYWLRRMIYSLSVHGGNTKGVDISANAV
jgi:hypothetical protein